MAPAQSVGFEICIVNRLRVSGFSRTRRLVTERNGGGGHGGNEVPSEAGQPANDQMSS